MTGFRGSDAQAAGKAKTVTWQVVAQALQLEIILGQLQPREHLVEDDIMERHNASRYAVRRALEELHALGLAIRTDNRGTRIRAYSDREVEDLYDFREVLETGAAQRIPMPVTQELVAELTRIQRLHDAASDTGRYFDVYQLNDEFHRTLFGACGNVLLTEAIAMYLLRAQPVRIRFIHDERRTREACQEHWEMIEALERNDRTALARICGAHVSRSKLMYLGARKRLSDGHLRARMT